MEFELITRYKSLKPFKTDVLPPFTVITGKNGSGKSQFVYLISQRGGPELAGKFRVHGFFRSIQAEGLELKKQSRLDNSGVQSRVSDYYHKYVNWGDNLKDLLELFMNNNIWPDGSNLKSVIDLLISKKGGENQLVQYLKDIYHEKNPNTDSQSLHQGVDAVAEFVFRQMDIDNPRLKSEVEVAFIVADFRQVEFMSLSFDDFLMTPIDISYIGDEKLFYTKIEDLFYTYTHNRDLNIRAYFDKKMDGYKNNAVSDKEFVERNPKPWSELNKIFEKNNLPFRFSGIERKNFRPGYSYELELVKTTNGERVQFEDLSSGEKVILGLIIKIFIIQYNRRTILPGLIVLDEPDAHLHPELSKLLINVLQNTFVKEYNVNIIMTTHSPSTIALCDPDSIFEMKNDPITSIERIDKDKALELLTDNIPTLSIDYKNHRQVMVESPTDIAYYQMIYNKLLKDHEFSHKLYFMSNGYGKGNRASVEQIVKDFIKGGNKSIYGVTDWDLESRSNERVLIHGNNKRYNIECFLLDPIYLCVLMMENKAHNISERLGFDEDANFYNIGRESNIDLQRICDLFFDDLFMKFPNDKSDESVVIEYYNGMKVTWPKKYATRDGKKSFDRIKKVYGFFNGFSDMRKLEEAMISVIAKCYPFIPDDSAQVILELGDG